MLFKFKTWMQIQEIKAKVIGDILSSEIIGISPIIDYAKFLRLYEPYKDIISEKELASILEINYKTMINGTRVKILKSMQKEIEELIQRNEKQLKKRIIEDIVYSGKIGFSQFVDYPRFLQFYEPYKEILTESEFGKLLEIRVEHIKTGGRSKILRSITDEIINKKEKKTIVIEFVDKIVEEIIEEVIRSKRQIIDYNQFLKLYEPYKKLLSERKFANIIQFNLYSVKETGKAKKILKSYSNQIESAIIEELLNGKVKIGEMIGYEHFLELYEPYKFMLSQKRFAQITELGYVDIRYKGLKSKIFKSKLKEIAEHKNEILKDFKILPKIYINYDIFLKLYEPYKNKVVDKEFAKAIDLELDKIKGGIAYRSLTYEEKSVILDNLLKDGKIKFGMLIDYKEFLKLYEPYKMITEYMFATILGINSGFGHMKYGELRRRIIGFKYKEKIEKIKDKLKDARYYLQSEIEELSSKYEISIDEIIRGVCCKRNETYVDMYMDILKRKGKIYLGKVECSEEFANTNARKMLNEANRYSNLLCFRYRCQDMKEDIASDAIMYVLNNCGDIERNFGINDENGINLMAARIYVYIQYSCMKREYHLKKFNTKKTFTSFKGEEQEVDIFDIIEDKSQNIEEKAEENIMRQMEETNHKQDISKEERCIDILNKCIEKGLNREQSIMKASQIMNITPKEMLELMQNYMIQQKKVKQTNQGEFILG